LIQFWEESILLANILLWGVYFPVLKILYALVFWVPEVVERRKFEQKNSKESQCDSFKKSGKRADYCFEFSSEGELQQVASLIEDGLNEGKTFELVFFSPSVEKAVIDLAKKFPDQIRYLRYPLLTFFPGKSFTNWISAKRLFLVRYDFFPEFLFWSFSASNSLTLLWVTFKKLRLKGKKPGIYKKLFLKQSSSIFYASQDDLNFGRQLGFGGTFYDFRIEQIRRRVSSRLEKFEKQFEGYRELRALLDTYPPHKRLILGNAWPSDLAMLKALPDDVFILIVPHKLEKNILDKFEEGLTELRADTMVTDGESIPNSRSLILNKKGVLCELYSDFDFGYVGGGFERSIHSILEPLVAGVSRISCGPANQRSTEFDLAKNQGRVSEVRSPEEFLSWFSVSDNGKSEEQLAHFLNEYDSRKRDVFSC
jgi:3-deoxy-D-manno-octulosonic-acid transferase